MYSLHDIGKNKMQVWHLSTFVLLDRNGEMSHLCTSLGVVLMVTER